MTYICNIVSARLETKWKKKSLKMQNKCQDWPSQSCWWGKHTHTSDSISMTRWGLLAWTSVSGLMAVRSDSISMLEPWSYQTHGLLGARYLNSSVFAASHAHTRRTEQFTSRETHITRLLLSFSGCSTAVAGNDAAIVVGVEGRTAYTESSQRFQVIVVSLQQAVGNPQPLMWELKGAVFSL